VDFYSLELLELLGHHASPDTAPFPPVRPMAPFPPVRPMGLAPSASVKGRDPRQQCDCDLQQQCDCDPRQQCDCDLQQQCDCDPRQQCARPVLPPAPVPRRRCSPKRAVHVCVCADAGTAMLRAAAQTPWRWRRRCGACWSCCASVPAAPRATSLRYVNQRRPRTPRSAPVHTLIDPHVACVRANAHAHT